MGALTETLRLVIDGDSAGARRALDTLEAPLSAQDELAQRVGRRWSNLGSQIMGAGKSMTAFITLPVVAGLGLSIKAASDLEETVNKVKVVFEDAAGSVYEFMEGSAQAVGMSKEQAGEAAATFGNLLASTGKTSDEVAGMSERFVTLAADIASINNLSMDEALEKLRSGLVGETEPLRSVGILLDDATLRQKAMEMGLVSTTKEALPQAIKMQAAYQAILDSPAAKKAQGDFKNTQDGLANSTKTATAELKNMAADLGTELIPMAKDAVGIGAKLVGVFNGMPGPLRKVMLGFALLAAAAGPATMAVGGVLRVYGGLITHGPKIVGTLGRLAGGFRNAAVAESAFSGAAGTLGGKLRIVVNGLGSVLTSSLRWLAKLPALIAGNLALAGTYTAIGLAAAASTVAVYEAIKAAQEMWQAENDLLAQKDANLAAEQDLERKLAEKYGRGSQKYQQGMQNAGMGGGVGSFDSGYSHPWYWGPAWQVYDKLRGFAEGGEFLTHGPLPIMVGDNPGGVEHVKVTPLSSGKAAAPTAPVHIHIGQVVGTDERAARRLADQVGQILMSRQRLKGAMGRA